MMQGLVIKAECTIFQNNIQINNKKKSKLSTISLQTKNKLLLIAGKGQNQDFKFLISKLKNIYKKFIQQGKITIEFDSQVKGNLSQGFSIINENINSLGNYQIFISNACKENLQTLVNNLVLLKKQLQQATHPHTNSKHQPHNQATQKQIPRKSKPEAIKQESSQQIHPKLGRKYLFSLSKNEQQGMKQKNKNNSIKSLIITTKQKIVLTHLPQILIKQIFLFSGVSLSQRLISKEIENIVLKNVSNIKLKQQIDEKTFNKLARWATNIEARPKYVKTLKLQDKNDDQILIKNKAKSLKFGNWKQISAKHIAQLKGLRIYCLQLPYNLKFQFSNIFGIRLVELRLKGKGVTVKNSNVKDQDILYMINTLNDLRVIEVSYSSTKLLCEIKKPQKMQEIRIGVLNKIGGFDDWINFKKFQNLQILAVEETQKMGNAEDQESVMLDASFPEKLKWLQIGFNISRMSRSLIPSDIKFLKLLGSHFKNSDIDNFFLPGLQKLDISYCPNLTPECLQNMGNLKVQTNWDKNRVDYANNYYSMNNIVISTVRGFSYC